jgi:nucleoside-diphosphate-sugar epimerase
MRVFLTGGSGVLGRALIPAFVAAGHSVEALAVTGEAAATVAALGGRPVAGDLLDPPGLDPIRADVVAHFATSIPRPDAGSGSWVLNDRIRTVGTANLLRAAAAGGVGRVVAYSVIWVYGDHGDDWITEETPLPGRTRPEVLSAVALEEAVRDSGLEWVIVRGGHLYGPGTGTTEALLAAAARGTLMTDGAGDAFDSLVTAADTAQVAVLAVERVPAGTILNAVDDRPMRQRELYEALAAYAGGPEPGRGPVVPGWGSLRVSNARARSFGFRPRHADVTSGLRALYRPAALDVTTV